MKDKKCCKVRDHCYYRGEYRGAAQSIYNLKDSISKEIFKVFHNGSNYNYQFIITGQSWQKNLKNNILV